MIKQAASFFVSAITIIAAATAIVSADIGPNGDSTSDTAVGRPQEAPVNTLPQNNKWWWNSSWYLDGILLNPTNYQVVERQVTYINSEDDTEVPSIIYPGIGRGFDFRPPNIRTFADDLATKDSVQRTADFMRQHLSP